MEAVTIQHAENEERFYKIQLADQNSFEEHLDSLQVRWESYCFCSTATYEMWENIFYINVWKYSSQPYLDEYKKALLV